MFSLVSGNLDNSRAVRNKFETSAFICLRELAVNLFLRLYEDKIAETVFTLWKMSCNIVKIMQLKFDGNSPVSKPW